MRRQQGNFSLLDCHGNKRLWLYSPTIRHLPLVQSNTRSWIAMESSGMGEGRERASTKDGIFCTKIFVFPHFVHAPKYFLLLSLPPVFGNEAGRPPPLCSPHKASAGCRDLSATAPHLCRSASPAPAPTFARVPTAALSHLHPAAQSSPWTQRVLKQANYSPSR